MDQALKVFPDDVLPPEAVFSSQSELLAAINEWASMRGYAFVARRSSKAKTLSQALTVTYVCDRGGGPRADCAAAHRSRCKAQRDTDVHQALR
ncbi:Uncharacterized protein HZ326_19720 [Fusarium oxysporum f. sp. albedinis]|nr:Uncharacterized protein HZ326_19720 [Fusarium oxysporum f. sp. albedinis]